MEWGDQSWRQHVNFPDQLLASCLWPLALHYHSNDFLTLPFWKWRSTFLVVETNKRTCESFRGVQWIIPCRNSCILTSETSWLTLVKVTVWKWRPATVFFNYHLTTILVFFTLKCFYFYYCLMQITTYSSNWLKPLGYMHIRYYNKKQQHIWTLHFFRSLSQTPH